MRPRDVALAKQWVDYRPGLIAAIADQLQIVGDPREPATLRIVPRPPEYPAVEIRLLNDLGDALEQVSADHGVPVDTLVDGVLRAWLQGDMIPNDAGQDRPA